MPPRSSSRPPRERRGGRVRPQGSPFDAGVRLLALRAHSRAELRRKLSRRGYDAEAVEAALARLAELGYLDDAAFARDYVRRRGLRLGPLALWAELAGRGVDRHVASEALAGLDLEGQVAAASRVAERLCAGKSWPGHKELLAGVGPKLLRRGFSPAVVRAACRAVWTGTGEPAEA